MTYERFEDLPVWEAAIEFAVKVSVLTAQEQFKGHGGLRDQLERAAVSISNNIAEGFERGTTQELPTFIYIARGSCGETRSVLCLLELLPHFRDLKSRSVSISRQLQGWANSLQNSQIKGQRYLTDNTRRASQAAREREEFLEELRRMQEERIAKLHERKTETGVSELHAGEARSERL